MTSCIQTQGEWKAAPKKRLVRREHAIVTPERPHQQNRSKEQHNSFQALQEITVEDLTQNKVVQHILRRVVPNQTQAQEPSLTDDDNSDSDTDSEMSTADREHDSTYEDLMAQLELTSPGSTDKITTKLNLAHVVRFREALGSILSTIPSRRYNWGHSWLVDTQDTYHEKMGEETPLPVMPKRPKEVPTTSASAVLKQYKRNLAHYLRCEDIRTAGLMIIEHKFPMSLEHKRTQHGLPHNLTLQDAFNHIEDRLRQGQQRITATINIKNKIATREYTHQNPTSCLSFLREMERDKEEIDTIGESMVTFTDLMMYCQQAFRNTLRKSTVRDIDNTWKVKLKELTAPHDSWATWTEFKEYYDKAFTEKDKDDILTENRGRAKAALAGNTLTDIQARLSDLETDTAQLDSAFSAMQNTTINQGYAPSVATHTNSVPNMVGTATDNTITALTTIMSSPDMKELLTTVMRDEIKRAIPKQQHNDGGGRQPRGSWDQWKYWCHTHGANLTHNSKECPRPRTGHKGNVTKTDPMGGNTRKDHLWMKYCHPTTYRAYDTPQE